MEFYRGVRHYYDEIAKSLVEFYPTEPSEFTLASYIEVYIRGNVAQYSAFKNLAVTNNNWGEFNLDGRLKKQIDVLLDNVINLKSQEEGLKLTEQVIELLLEYVEPEDNQQGDSSGDDSKDSQKGDSSEDDSKDSQQGDSSEDDSKDNQQGDSSEDDSKDNQQGDSSEDDSKDGQKGDSSEDDSKDNQQSDSSEDGSKDNQQSDSLDVKDLTSKKDQKELLDDLINGKSNFVDSNETVSEILSDEENQDDTMQNQQSSEMNQKLANPAQVLNGDGLGDELINATLLETSLLRNRLNALVADETRSKKQTLKRGRKVNGRKVYRIQSGRTDIFIKTNKSEFKPNSAVSILIDCSSSIGESMPIVQKAAYTLFDALTVIPGVDTSGFSFGGMYTDYRLKSFNETSKAAAGRIETLTPDGTTPLESTLFKAIQDLYSVKNKKRVLIVLTDGSPNDLRQCKNIINDMHKNEVLCLGIGMGGSINERQLKSLYGKENYMLVKNFSELPEQLINLAKRLIFTSL